eukprot:jgi/Bigna1/65589/fgenesh1_kg.117_\
MPSMDTFQAGIGAVLMIHSLVSMQHFKEFAMATESRESPPLDIILECLLGMSLCIIAVVTRAGNFMTNKAAPYSAKKTFDSLSYRKNFAIFNHRPVRLDQKS